MGQGAHAAGHEPLVSSCLSWEKGSMDPLRCRKITAYLSSRKHSTLLLPRDPVLKLSMKRTCASARAIRHRYVGAGAGWPRAHRVLLERHGRAPARHQHDATAHAPARGVPLHKRLNMASDAGARRWHLLRDASSESVLVLERNVY